MTTKTIMMMALSATLILGTFSMSSAFAIEQGDRFKIKSNSLYLTDGGFYDQATKATLKVKNVDDTVSGNASVNVSLNSAQLDNINFKGKNLEFAYVPNGGNMTISGPLKANNGSIWDFEMDIQNLVIADTENNRIKADCSSTLTSPGVTTITQPPTECGLTFTGDFELPDK